MGDKEKEWWENRLDLCPDCDVNEWIPMGSQLVYSVRHGKYVIQADACCERCGIGITKFFNFAGTTEERDQILSKQSITRRVLILSPTS